MLSLPTLASATLRTTWRASAGMSAVILSVTRCAWSWRCTPASAYIHRVAGLHGNGSQHETRSHLNPATLCLSSSEKEQLLMHKNRHAITKAHYYVCIKTRHGQPALSPTPITVMTALHQL